ncbi:MAG: hypothetical protein ABJ000_08965 [Saccharospirillum sp.]|uniref:hypothetical protein n=1 Tax=Saccharospirillum sp. TaxID=2033801 RepID=UPI003298D1F6
MSIDVRKAKVGDEVRMAEIQVAAWRRAYSGMMSPALLDALDINQKTDMWRNALERAGKGSYLVAEVSGRVEGFAVFGPARPGTRILMDPSLLKSFRSISTRISGV